MSTSYFTFKNRFLMRPVKTSARAEALPCPPLASLLLRVSFILAGLITSVCATAQNEDQYSMLNRVEDGVYLPKKDTGIVFYEKSWAEVKAEAARTGKMIFVDAYAEWCGPCKMLAKNVFPDPQVGAFFNANFVNWHIDMETPEGEAFGAEYPLDAYPTLYFMDKEGKLVKQKTGYRNVGKLLELADLALHPERDTVLKSWNRRYAAGERGNSFLYAYLYALALNDESFDHVLNEIHTRMQPADMMNDTAFQVFCLNETRFDSKLGKHFRDHYADFLKKDEETTKEKAVKLLNAGFNEIYEKKDAKRLAELKTYVKAIWKDEEQEELLKKIDEEYAK